MSGRKGYLSLQDIGYGTGDGFGGWNCRHDWYPFFEGVSDRIYGDAELARLNEKDIEYNGRKYSEYDISQMQRKFERDIRSIKREAVAYDTARTNAPNDKLKQQFSDDFTKTAVKLKNKERQLNDFLKQTEQLPDNARTQVLGFGRSAAQKAVWANKKSPLSLTKFLSDGTITDKETEFKKNLKLGRFNTKIEESKQKRHQLTPEWKNQVKQAVKSNGKQTPKSRLNKDVDPQKIVNKYGGTGRISISGDKKTVNEYITFPDSIGVTFNKTKGRYEKTNVIQIKYTENGIHIFPTISRKED